MERLQNPVVERPGDQSLRPSRHVGRTLIKHSF